ncbi:hypothetical protein [Streptomyces sp. Qhu_M48]|uniref:hypothetical protein n=1 Tax=Streptomyces sp. Qhu_M48 TaxID=3435889 RepID=UPI003F500C71
MGEGEGRERCGWRGGAVRRPPCPPPDGRRPMEAGGASSGCGCSGSDVRFATVGEVPCRTRESRTPSGRPPGHPHFDAEHIDAGHGDLLGHHDIAHFDIGHLDSPHVDAGHIDGPHGHGDQDHLDSSPGRLDFFHVDADHGDAPHFDLHDDLHADKHDDEPHSDEPAHDDRADPPPHEDAPSDDYPDTGCADHNQDDTDTDTDVDLLGRFEAVINRFEQGLRPRRAGHPEADRRADARHLHQVLPAPRRDHRTPLRH